MKTFIIYFFNAKNDAKDVDLADYSLEAFYNEKENIIEFKNYRFLSFCVLDKNLFEVMRKATLSIVRKKYNKIKICDASGRLGRCYE